MKPFELTEHERLSALWVKLRNHLEDRLQDHRMRNDNEASAEETAKVRGRIAELKDLIKLGNEKPKLGI